ncbi:MAG: hypothetical protein K6T57_08835 [Thermaceae bacterium]|nr:hypothetical protein [Thermaceae bacterium]
MDTWDLYQHLLHQARDREHKSALRALQFLSRHAHHFGQPQAPAEAIREIEVGIKILKQIPVKTGALAAHSVDPMELWEFILRLEQVELQRWNGALAAVQG